MQTFTVHEFNQMFPDEESCLDAVKDMLYPDGIPCRKCGQITRHHRLERRKAYSCDACGTHVYPLAGTIFAKSSTPLKSWFYAIFLLASTRTGISSKQLQRELGVTYKTALRMSHQIRALLAGDDGSLSGVIEVDETYVGGKRPGKRGRGAEGKTVMAGMVQRGGQAIVKVVPNVKAKTLLPIIQEHIPVAPGTTIFSDELKSYNRLSLMGYKHETVQHAAKEYVRGAVHVNNIENIWGNTKRGIDGVHHSVSPQHLQSYLDSFVFRYNHRRDEKPMFQSFLERVVKVRHGAFGDYAPIG